MQIESLWICIGTVGKAHGLRGHFYLSQREGPLNFKSGMIRIGNDPLKPLLLAKLVQQIAMGDKLVVRCEEIKSREDLANWTNQSVWVARDELVKSESSDTMLWADFIGKTVKDSVGLKLGHVESVHNFGASDILSISGTNGKRLNIPLIPRYIKLPIDIHAPELSLLVSADDFAEFWQ